MTEEAPGYDDFLSNPAPPPKAVEGHPNALQAVDRKTAPKGRLNLAPVTNDLAEQLRQAPVAAEPQTKGPAAEPAPQSDPKLEPKGNPASAAKPKGDKGSAPPPPRPGRPRGEIWDGCPVKALGVKDDHFYFLDRHGQMRITKAEMKASQILGYFGRIELLRAQFPKYSKGSEYPELRNFNSQAANFTMIEAAHEKGLFNPDGAVRGVGAWKAEDGSLIYHTGASLITATGSAEPGEIEGLIYPAYPPIPAPTLSAGRGDPAMDTLAQMNTWNWGRQDTDPMLTLGMVGCQMLGGALDWRPAFWFTGDKSSGKSTLHELIKWLHGDKGLIQSNDPTKSGITSRLGHSSLPVAIDELEPGDEGSSKERDIITLARISSSGGQWLRGTADQKGASGNVYSTFMFSSILIPGALGAADRSRLIVLSLAPPDKDAVKPVIDPRTWKARGAALKRTLIDRWPTWGARLQLWREALAEHNLTGRNGDNWATCIAMADMALSADLPSVEVLTTWAIKVAFAAKGQIEEIGSNAEDMLTHLIGQPFDVYRRGELFTVGQWIMVAAELPAAPRELVLGAADAGADPLPGERAVAARKANEKLARAGMRVKGRGAEAQLFIANKPIAGLCKLFEHSTWSNSVWKQAAARVPGAEPDQCTLAGVTTRGVYLPLKNVSGLLAFPMDRAGIEDRPHRAPPTPADHEDFV